MGVAVTRRQRQRAQLWGEMVRVARSDLDAVQEEIASLEADIDLDQGAARDAYYTAVALHRDADGKLIVANSLDDLRAVARLSGRARIEMAAARGWLRGKEPESEPALCFFDPAHGPAHRSAVFAPDGGKMQQLPACDACAEEVDAGRAPPMRKVMVDGYPQPYWRSPAHAGYYGKGSNSLDDLLDDFVFGTGMGGTGLFGVGFGVLDTLIELLDDLIGW